jgi:hypothetical protein
MRTLVPWYTCTYVRTYVRTTCTHEVYVRTMVRSTRVLVFVVVFGIMLVHMAGSRGFAAIKAAQYADQPNFVPFIVETGRYPRVEKGHMCREPRVFWEDTRQPVDECSTRVRTHVRT